MIDDCELTDDCEWYWLWPLVKCCCWCCWCCCGCCCCSCWWWCNCGDAGVEPECVLIECRNARCDGKLFESMGPCGFGTRSSRDVCKLTRREKDIFTLVNRFCWENWKIAKVIVPFMNDFERQLKLAPLMYRQKLLYSMWRRRRRRLFIISSKQFLPRIQSHLHTHACSNLWPWPRVWTVSRLCYINLADEHHHHQHRVMTI